jgi:acyl-CoA thioesterase
VAEDTPPLQRRTAEAERAREPSAAAPFERDTAVEMLELEGPRASFAAEVADGWRAGRGPHGGYLAAIILRALTLALDDAARQPRSLTIHFLLAPRSGPVVIETAIERAGRSLSSLSSRMIQDGNTVALALAAFSVPWVGPEVSELPVPEVAPPDAQRRPGALIPPERGGPPFGRHITFQHRIGGRPFAGGAERMETGGWIGLVEPRELDALALAFFTDALIPAPFMRLQGPAPAPTIDITIHFRTALPPPSPDGGGDPHQLVLARSHADTLHEGFFVEDAVIWSREGALLAQSRQLALVIG